MSDSNDVDLSPAGKVWLRLAFEDRPTALERLPLPVNVGGVSVGDPTILCVAPARWLFLSERQSSDDLICAVSSVLADLLFVSGDASS